jgi:5-(aminomethyl)-3-furanmethanol phosphate kinase
VINAVIKVGGSLSRGGHLPALGKHLGELGKRHPLLVVPGGGPFADLVRDQGRRFALDDTTAHWMAILGMDQYGWLLARLIPGGEPVWSMAGARAVAQEGRVPILLPWALLYAADPLPHSWEVTSDSIAAWVAGMGGVQLLILLKDVDGLLDRPQGTGAALLRESASAEELGRSGVVDSYLPDLLSRYGLDLWLINGEQPERLAEVLATGATTGTRLVGRGDRTTLGPSVLSHVVADAPQDVMPSAQGVSRSDFS